MTGRHPRPTTSPGSLMPSGKPKADLKAVTMITGYVRNDSSRMPGGSQFPQAMAPADAKIEPSSRSVQPAFQDVSPGIVPNMKPDAGSDLREKPGGRFAKQIAELPEETPDWAERT